MKTLSKSPGIYPYYIKSPKCPDCGCRIAVDAFEHDAETGKPTPDGFHFYCENDCEYSYSDAVVIEQEIIKKLEL